MRKILFHKATVISLALGFATPGFGGANGEVAAYQLFYLFDPDSNRQLQGAFVLQTTAEAEGIELSGIVDLQDLGSPALNRLEFPILSIGELQRQDQLAAEAAEDWFRSRQRGGLLLVKDNGTGTTTAVTGERFQAAINRLSSKWPIRTEVDVTTWGKVKDIFN